MMSFSLVVCVFFVVTFDFVIAQFQSPCPDVFEYDLDDRERLFGRITVPNPAGSNVDLSVELSVGNSVQGFNGNIELVYSRTKAVQEIVRGRPLDYNLIFPEWHRFPPKVTKIFINGVLICSGPPLDIKRVPVLTTINLRHTLKISSLSLASDGLFDPTSLNNKPETWYQPSNDPSLNNINQQRPPNKDSERPQGNFYFQFGAPSYQVPSQQYPGNPFFALPSTEKPQVGPFFTIPTTERSPGNSFFDIIRTTEKPQGNPFYFIPNNFPSTEKPKTTPTSTTTTTATPPIPDDDPQIDVRSDVHEICGKSLATNSLIANGSPVFRGYYPWLVALFNIQRVNPKFTCGGSLISTRHIVTAAHCLRSKERMLNNDELLIVLGKYNIQQWGIDKDALMLNPQALTIHPDYKVLSSDADIGVVTLPQAVKFKKFVRPICLWSGANTLEDVVGQYGIVAGWGKGANDEPLTAEPKEVTMPIVSQVDCLRSHDDFGDITSKRTFCAGFRNGSGPCNGDSGGGFMMHINGRWILRGVVSMSLANESRSCDLSQYLVFTDVSKFFNWILDIIR